MSLLDRLVLPAGAQISRSEPAGGGSILTRPAQGTASGDLVDLHRWWVVPEQPEAVNEFHPVTHPAESHLDLHGTSGFAGAITSWVVGYQWEAEPDVLASRSLLVEVVALPGGQSGVRADAQDIWLAPSPPADFVPASARLLEVEVTISGQEPVLAKRTADSQTVAAVRAMIDRMPLNPGGVCYGKPGGRGAQATFTFRAARGDPPLAVASVTADVEAEEGPCQALTLSLSARRRTVRLEWGPFIREVQSLLGVQIYVSPERLRETELQHRREAA